MPAGARGEERGGAGKHPAAAHAAAQTPPAAALSSRVLVAVSSVLPRANFGHQKQKLSELRTSRYESKARTLPELNGEV